MDKIKHVTGFVVNVHDAVNFDIDLKIPSKFLQRYSEVVTNDYKYQRLCDVMENKVHCNTIVGTSYRCRLKGIGIYQKFKNSYKWKHNQIHLEVQHLIDRADGWVVCNLYNVDSYKRLLVDVMIPTCHGCIDLKEYLLKKMENTENPIFYCYKNNKDQNNEI